MNQEKLMEIARAHRITPDGFEDDYRDDAWWDLPLFTDQAVLAMDGLSGLPSVPVGGRRARTSYGLKHELERRAGAYISNGALIVAALALGIEIKRMAGSPRNALIGVTTGQRN